MKQRLADYVADFLVDHGVKDCFTVVGGGAMHLNDAFGHKEGLNCTYNHHEQASAIAAEAYARLNNTPALLCVTTGPGGTNAITGVLGAWLDSIPMFVVSGQVRYDTTARYGQQFTDGLELRAVGDQEYEITKSVSSMCKYAEMLESPDQIRYMLEKAWARMKSGRPGPIWLDIPVNFQGVIIETDDLSGYITEDDSEVPPSVNEETVQLILDKIAEAERPVIYAGNGIRIAGAYHSFRKLADKLGVPVVTYWDSIDLIENEHPLYCGRGGNMGDRAGNFAVQNSDFILAIGTRLSIRQVGYNWQTWARAAEVAMVDIDRAEFKKHTIHVDIPIWADAKDFIDKANLMINDDGLPLFKNESWRVQCVEWKNKYPVVLDRHKAQNSENKANVFAFVDYLTKQLPENSLTAVSNGACCVVGHQCWDIKKGTRFIVNSAVASMGYGLPASIGLCVSAGKKETVCLEGDGSIMMNLQELQTIVTNNLPIKIFLINNQGYHSIRQTQNNIFKDHCKVGIGPESGDLSFPKFELVAKAFGYPYFCAADNDEMKCAVADTLAVDGYAFCEIITDTVQIWEPKNSARRLPDGKIVSPPLEDLAPFLPRDEIKKNMYIPMVGEE